MSGDTRYVLATQTLGQPCPKTPKALLVSQEGIRLCVAVELFLGYVGVRIIRPRIRPRSRPEPTTDAFTPTCPRVTTACETISDCILHHVFGNLSYLLYRRCPRTDRSPFLLLDVCAGRRKRTELEVPELHNPPSRPKRSYRYWPGLTPTQALTKDVMFALADPDEPQKLERQTYRLTNPFPKHLGHE
jgi:hypothetical protein